MHDDKTITLEQFVKKAEFESSAEHITDMVVKLFIDKASLDQIVDAECQKYDLQSLAAYTRANRSGQDDGEDYDTLESTYDMLKDAVATVVGKAIDEYLIKIDSLSESSPIKIVTSTEQIAWWQIKDITDKYIQAKIEALI